MSTLSAIVLVASSYFVCGFCLDLGIPVTDVHASLMKTILNHGQRQNFRRLDQSKQFWFADPSLADFVHFTEIRSSGANKTFDVTVTATFLQAANFTWIYYANNQLMCTLGEENYNSGITMTTSIDVNVNNNFALALWMQTKSFVVYMYFDQLEIAQAGVQAATNYYFSFNAPNKVDVNENGDVTFDVTLPIPSNYSLYQHLRIFHTYMNDDTDEYEREILYYQASSITGTSDMRITIPNEANNTWGLITLIIVNLDDLDTVSDTSFSRMHLMKMVDIRNNGAGLTKDMVTFNPATKSTYHVNGDDLIRYGSVVCSASGWPQPTIEITKDGQVLNTIVMRQTKFSIQVYVPLDGKTKAEAVGVYNCTATSGSKSITRPINVVE